MIDYKSPIEIWQSEIEMQMEGEVSKACRRVGVQVDKEELLKALQYDREQYKKGYQDGLNADKWIPCEERLPSKYEEVLCCDIKGNQNICVLFKDSVLGLLWKELGSCSSIRFDYITAWQPLPAPYKKEGAERWIQ